MHTTKTQYGLLTLAGRLARCESYDNHGDFCGERRYSLTGEEGFPEWLVDDPQDVADTLFQNTPWYNTDWERPGWGKFTRDQLVPVKVVTSVTIEPTDEVKIPPNLIPVETREIPWLVARKYTTRELPRRNYVMVLCAATPEEAREHEGQVVHFGDIYTKRRLVAAEPLPADYDVPAEPQRSLLLCIEA